VSHPGWIQDVVSRFVGEYGRVALALKCGCVVVRSVKTEPKRARCEKQRGCKWRTPEIDQTQSEPSPCGSDVRVCSSVDTACIPSEVAHAG
jgi:hypothetical protein